MSPRNEDTLVLVADDEPSMLALLSAYIRSKGYRVLEASDGDMAWQLAHQHLPNVVVLDVMMPGMSGWEVCKKIRESVSLAHTGVVMLTGIGESLNELTSPLYGADAYIDKPFEFAELESKIKETLERRRGGALGRPDGGDEVSDEEDDDQDDDDDEDETESDEDEDEDESEQDEDEVSPGEEDEDEDKDEDETDEEESEDEEDEAEDEKDDDSDEDEESDDEDEDDEDEEKSEDEPVTRRFNRAPKKAKKKPAPAADDDEPAEDDDESSADDVIEEAQEEVRTSKKKA